MRTRVTIAAVAAASFVAGYWWHYVFSRIGAPPQSVADHWSVVNSYRDAVNNPANYKPDPRTGLSVMEPPPDPEPSLFALVNAGELEHVDLVFPTVAATPVVNRHWMKVVAGRDDILHATGNSSGGRFQTKGTEPLHLNLWFKPSAGDAIRQLIDELEAMEANRMEELPAK